MVVKGNRLTAEEGMKLINADNSIAVEVWLAPSDSIANWREVTEEEAIRIEEEREKAEREAREVDNVVE